VATRVQIALAQHQIGLARHLDLVGVLGAEQHPVTELDRSDVLADAGHLSPDQALGDLRGGGDEDAAPAGPLPGSSGRLDHDSVVQHLNRQGGVGHLKEPRGSIPAADRCVAGHE
jgi:hypothetical protein